MKLRHYSDREDARKAGWSFFCPGCAQVHTVNISGSQPLWTFNNNEAKPTFRPSLKIQYWHGEPTRQYICHSIITDGTIAYCSDSTHSLKGQTVPMPDWPYDE